MTENKIEIVYEAIANKIDNLGEEKANLFLAKLSLLLANKLEDTSFALKAIDVIINEISNLIRGKSLYKDKDELIDNMLNYLNQNRKEEFVKTQHIFENEKITIEDIDYYFSNVIAKNSKTMSECRSLRSNLQITGTDG